MRDFINKHHLDLTYSNEHFNPAMLLVANEIRTVITIHHALGLCRNF
ncbi:hypothetical protein GPX45_08320 [Streptococcus thermophilus]|nr:hypothetical protein [Streptococcus thermophilus]MCE2300775.1 hypothetical protein [Streptococcus thermophilus]MCE2302541.1 hypothetical protein [Streptococcus thermophilus]MCE2307402.1 hypothetical protein [Streptococcus thermophilus]